MIMGVTGADIKSQTSWVPAFKLCNYEIIIFFLHLEFVVRIIWKIHAKYLKVISIINH